MGLEIDSATLTSFAEEERRQAVERFGVLRPHVEDGVSLARLARQHGMPLRTPERWLHRLAGWCASLTPTEAGVSWQSNCSGRSRDSHCDDLL
jgi:hypothetical protein